MHSADLTHWGKGNGGFWQKEVKVCNAFAMFEEFDEYDEGDSLCITYLGFMKALPPQELSKQ